MSSIPAGVLVLPAGMPGIAGPAGTSPYTALQSPFIQPAAGGTVTISVVNTGDTYDAGEWVAIAGNFYLLQSFTSTTMTLQYPTAVANIGASGTLIGNAADVVLIVAPQVTDLTIPESANLVLAGPASGSAATPTYRALVANDIPGTLNQEIIAFTNTATSGAIAGLKITPTYNQTSGSAANTDLLINRTQTAVGSGSQRLIDAQVGGSSKFYADTSGNLTMQGALSCLQNLVYTRGINFSSYDSATGTASQTGSGNTFVILSASSTSYTYTLRAFSGTGTFLWFKRTDNNAAYTITLQCASGSTIDGASSYALGPLNALCIYVPSGSSGSAYIVSKY